MRPMWPRWNNGWMMKTVDRTKWLAGLLVFAGLLGACSPVSANDQATATPTAAASAPVTLHPISGLAIIPLTVTGAHGTHSFRVEVAATSLAQERGLMFRKAMGADEGMIFPMDPPRRTAFWMHNTLIGLDIIFIGPDHRILNIAADAKPEDDTNLPSAGDAAGVLELNAGRAAQLGIEPGDTVNW